MAERELIDVRLGTPMPMNPLYQGEVADGGARIRVWASRERYGVTVAHNIQARSHAWEDDEPEYRVTGGATLSIGGGLSLEQAEALVTELTLCIAAKRLADGEPWDGQEIAPGILRAPERRER